MVTADISDRTAEAPPIDVTSAPPDALLACLIERTTDKSLAPRMSVALQFSGLRQRSETHPICALDARRMTGIARFLPSSDRLLFNTLVQGSSLLLVWSAAHLTRDADNEFFRMRRGINRNLA